MGCPALTLLNLNRCAHESDPDALSQSHHDEVAIMHAHMHAHMHISHGAADHGPMAHGPMAHGPMAHGPMAHGPMAAADDDDDGSLELSAASSQLTNLSSPELSTTASRLVQLTNLSSLELSTTASRLVRPLLACASLTWLDVGWLADLIDDTAAALLLRGLSLLQVLSLEGCKNLTDAALAPLLAPLLSSRPPSTLDPPPSTTDHRPPTTAGMALYPVPGGRLLRLNCSWVDCITTDAIHNTLLAANARRTAAQLQARSQLQVLAYPRQYPRQY